MNLSLMVSSNSLYSDGKVKFNLPKCSLTTTSLSNAEFLLVVNNLILLFLASLYNAEVALPSNATLSDSSITQFSRSLISDGEIDPSETFVPPGLTNLADGIALISLFLTSLLLLSA